MGFYSRPSEIENVEHRTFRSREDALVSKDIVKTGMGLKMVDEDRGYEAYSQGNYELAVEEWSARALAGDPFAKYSLGMMYEHGSGVEQSLESAIRLYAQAGEEGVPQATHNLAWIYIRGAAGEDLIAEGVRLLEGNANNGFGPSQSDIAHMYRAGDYVEQDTRKAIVYLEFAAEQGAPSALNTLGMMYRYGDAFPHDLEKARELFEAAAEQSDPIGMFNLGGLHLDGTGVPQNIDEAIKWIEGAARQGLPQAQVNLGALYVNGEAVSRDYSEGLKWYRMAAEQGDPIGQNNLGLMYLEGHGVEKDDETAFYWLTVALMNGHDGSREVVEKVRSTLSPSQVERVLGLIDDAGGGERTAMGNIELWLRHANELGLSSRARKGLLFLCSACGSLGNDREFIARRLNWLFPIDPTIDLGEKCGGMYDGKIKQLIEEVLHHLKAEIDFREIKIGDVSITALTPAPHGLLPSADLDDLTMFSVDGLYADFLDKLGSALEESDFDEEHAYFAGIFYLQANVQTDVNGFLGTFGFIEQSMPPAYRYLVDMSAIGDAQQLENFIPFQRVLYAFLRGMPQQIVEPLWSLQSYVFYRSDPNGDMTIQYLPPRELLHEVDGAIGSYLAEFPGVLESVSADELLSAGIPNPTGNDDPYERLEDIVRREWGGELGAFDTSSSGGKLTLNVCVFYAATAMKLGAISQENSTRH
jgi:TPR repeat protein